MPEIERLLLAKMLTAEDMTKVVDSGITPEAFEDPFHRKMFQRWLSYWCGQEGENRKAPTKRMWAEDFPGIEIPATVDAEETTEWYLTALQRRHKTNRLQDIVRRAAENMDHPEALKTLWQEAKLADEQAGRVGNDDGMPKLWSVSDLAPAAQPRWLAKNRLPRAAVSLLVGDEGIGKSLFWVYLAAAITTGKPLQEFGVPTRDPDHVVVVVTEDDWSTTVRPRLEVAGADLAMVRVICTEEDGSGAPEFPRDLHLITEADPAPALVVVDAWLDTVSSRLSVKDPQQARQALHPWREVAVTTDAAVLLLTHTNRVASATTRDKYGATGELRKKARMALFAQRDDDGNLVIGPDKANAAAAVMASRFTVRGVQYFPPTDDHDGTVPLLAYVGDTDQTAQEHTAEAYESGRSGSRQAKLDQAILWMRLYLANGPKWSSDLFRDAEAGGHSRDRIKKAKSKDEAGIVSRKDGDTKAWYSFLQGHEDWGPPEGSPRGEDCGIDPGDSV